MAGLPPITKWRAFTATGAPLVGGKLYTYVATTATPKATYTDYGGLTANANPVVLDANGEADIWLGTGYYKFVLKNSAGVTQWTMDNVSLPTAVASGLPIAGTIRQVLKKINSTNYNAEWVDLIYQQGTSSSPATISAATGINYSLSYSDKGIIYVQSNSGAVTVVANPQIAAGQFEGQELKVIQMSATNTLKFTDGTGLALSGASDLILDQVRKMAVFHWDHTGSLWVEQSRS